jgi:hypothetical protein
MNKNNNTFLIEEHNSFYDAFNKLEKDVSETDEEYVSRVKQMPPVEVGLAFMDISQKNISNENLLFSFSLEQSPPFVLEEPDVFYVSLKDVENLSQKENLLKYSLQVSLTVLEGTVMADTKTFALKISIHDISCHPVYLKKQFLESDQEYCNRIKNIPSINIGNLKLQKELYNSQLELFPGYLEMHKWSERATEIDQEAFLKIDKVNARKLYINSEDHPVFSQFKVVDNIVHLDNTKIIFGNHTYVFSGMEYKEFNTTAFLAIKGDAAAQYRLGEIYFHGELGNERNVIDAVSWFLKAYLQGNGKSLLQLIHILVQRLIPIGLLKHLEDFLEEALKEGTSEDKYLYAQSFVDEEDYERAAIWFKKAALQGSQEAGSQLLILEKGKLIPQGENNAILSSINDQETNKLDKDDRKFIASIQSIKFIDNKELKLEVTDFIGELNVKDKLVFYKNGSIVSKKNYVVNRIFKLNLPNRKPTMNIYINGSKFDINTKSDQVRVE